MSCSKSKGLKLKYIGIVEKKQLNVLFLQIVVDIALGSGYYGFIVTHKSSKGMLRKSLAIKIF